MWLFKVINEAYLTVRSEAIDMIPVNGDIVTSFVSDFDD